MMKNYLVLIFMISVFMSFGQKRTVESFEFQDINIEYSRVDYSKYGILHFFIAMYENDPELELIEKKATESLKKEDNIYHTLYLFLKIPAIITSQDEKERLFSKFVKHLGAKEKLDQFNLYLNFDVDYSNLYQEETLINQSLNKVNRIYLKILPNNISKGLHISK